MSPKHFSTRFTTAVTEPLASSPSPSVNLYQIQAAQMYLLYHIVNEAFHCVWISALVHKKGVILGAADTISFLWLVSVETDTVLKIGSCCDTCFDLWLMMWWLGTHSHRTQAWATCEGLPARQIMRWDYENFPETTCGESQDTQTKTCEASAIIDLMQPLCLVYSWVCLWTDMCF